MRTLDFKLDEDFIAFDSWKSKFVMKKLARTTKEGFRGRHFLTF